MSINKFSALGVHEAISRVLATRNIVSPTPLQATFLPLFKQHPNTTLVLRDQTGTGKTFGLAVALADLALAPILPTSTQEHAGISPAEQYDLDEIAKENGQELLNSSCDPVKKADNLLKCQSLVLVPNRYLASQLADWLSEIAHAAAAGAGRKVDMDTILGMGYRGGPPVKLGPTAVFVTTASNAVDLFEDNKLDLDSIENVILDEVDQLVPPVPEGNSKTDMAARAARLRHAKPAETIVSRILERRAHIVASEPGASVNDVDWVRYVMSSATVGRSVVNHVRQVLGWMRGAPLRVIDATGVGGVLPRALRHRILAVPDDCFDIAGVVSACMAHLSIDPGSVLVAEVSDRMTNRQLSSYAEKSAVHKALLARLCKQRKEDLRIITGIRVLEENVSRGIDAPGAEHVFITSPPKDEIEYLHLAGRVARMGREGTVTTIVPRSQKAHMDAILLSLGAEQVVELPAAVGDLFCERASISEYAKRVFAKEINDIDASKSKIVISKVA